MLGGGIADITMSETDFRPQLVFNSTPKMLGGGADSSSEFMQTSEFVSRMTQRGGGVATKRFEPNEFLEGILKGGGSHTLSDTNSDFNSDSLFGSSSDQMFGGGKKKNTKHDDVSSSLSSTDSSSVSSNLSSSSSSDMSSSSSAVSSELDSEERKIKRRMERLKKKNVKDLLSSDYRNMGTLSDSNTVYVIDSSSDR